MEVRTRKVKHKPKHSLRYRRRIPLVVQRKGREPSAMSGNLWSTASAVCKKYVPAIGGNCFISSSSGIKVALRE